MPTPDGYARLDYAGLIAWPERLQREAPLLRRVLGEGGGRRLLDLGCGSGEHARFLTTEGWRVTGVDASASQVAAARAADPGGCYLEAGLAELPGPVPIGQEAALCLGNTLPHLETPQTVRAFLTGLARCLAPGAPVLLQLLNYDRILDRGERTFPVVLRPDSDGGEAVFLRLMTHHGDGRLTFVPARLALRQGAHPPLELVASEAVALQGWRRAEVEAFLAEAGYRVEAVLGSMTGAPWTPESSDLVVMAKAPGS